MREQVIKVLIEQFDLKRNWLEQFQTEDLRDMLHEALELPIKEEAV